MTSPSNRNPITGDKLQTKPSTKEYRDGWDAIFSKVDSFSKADSLKESRDKEAEDMMKQLKEDK